MTKYLFFDTETTGLPENYKAPSSDLDNWPRIVQIAWILKDENATLNERTCIIFPNGFEIPKSATAIHGITTKMACEMGHPLKNVMACFSRDLMAADIIVAHNLSFDIKIVGAEFLRTEVKNDLTKKSICCTMQSSTEYCELPGKHYGYKWPKLSELYYKLFDETLKDGHDAMIDTEACAKCFFELKRLGVIKV
jgi:DNA polymerase III subunit epsilon